ncbi:MAG: SUV3 C-terminal domain-containing protein [Sulfurovum sp.]
MAKKKKYLIKLNNKIRNYFGGEPFDEGVTTLGDDKLIELMMLLEIAMPSYSRDEMIRTLRRIWSEGDTTTRTMIVSYLTQSYKAIPYSSTKRPLDRVEKILMFLDGVEYNKHEENLLLEAFVDVRDSRITEDKVLNKLHYIRTKSRLGVLETSLDIIFTTLNEMEFYHSFSFALESFDFNKLLLCKSISLSMDELWTQGDDAIIEKLQEIKQSTIEQKNEELEAFLDTVKNSHYLNQNEIMQILKSMPPESGLYDAPISMEIIERVIDGFGEKYHISQSQDHIIIDKDKSLSLFGTTLHYITSVNYGKPLFSNFILRGNNPPIKEDLHSVNEELLAHFNIAIDDILEDMRDKSSKIEIEESKLHEFIIRFIEPHISSANRLKIKEKIKRRILFHFIEYIKPIQEKQKREELLAMTIRDFKKLFPLARELKREIIFHIGATNSGKTYEALKTLKEANTGYYLAPLRLLALEGYENLKEDGVSVSLITGEEEIIDEDSTHISSTIEMMNVSVDVDVCVIDEIQMIGDRDRGWAWANALIGVPAKKIILTGSLDARLAVEEICEYLGEKLTVIEFERKTELVMMSNAVNIKDIEPQTAVIAFSRRDVLSLKQQLSQDYSVSVIYGNLSPEVRREEARRFRAKESEILVSTDAIAMGLNLPIKMILFSKDNKFDGVSRRKLLPAEVLQISGRAGRYGMQERGFVGALDEPSLSTITKAFHSPLPNITLPISVMASLEHIMLIGEILESDDILEILEFFADNMEFEGPFKTSNIDSMLEIASIVSEYHLDLKTKFILSCAPASISSPYIESVFHRYIKQIEAGGSVLYIPPRDLPKFAQTNDMLLNAEDRVREISLYLWLSFKFPEQFEDTHKAINARVRLNQFIENSLRQGHFTKKCSKCGKVLDFSYRFSICDGCHSKGGSGAYKRRFRGGRNK